MGNRFNNKKLLYLLAGLTALLVFTLIVKVPREKATIKSRIVELDTSQVAKILLYPKVSNGKTVEFEKINNKWSVKQENIVASAREGAVQDIFMEILNMKPQSLASVSKSKWKDFELTDSLATRIKFISKNGKTLGDLMIGKFSYKQPDNPYGGYGGYNIQMTSFVRAYGENEVYAVNGMAPVSMNRKFDDWRDNQFVHFNTKDVTNIRLTFPADSGYVLSKKDNYWIMGDQKADSAAVANYLNTISSLKGQDFRDNFKPSVNPVYQLQADGSNLLNFKVKCYQGDSPDEYILNSSLNPEIYYSSKRNGLFDQLFKSRSNFLQKAKK
jgi:hypothetical protein